MGKELRLHRACKGGREFALEINLNLLRNKPGIGIVTIRKTSSIASESKKDHLGIWHLNSLLTTQHTYLVHKYDKMI